MKKFISTILTFTMVFSISSTALAANPTIPSNSQTVSVDSARSSWIDRFKIAKWILYIAGQALTQESDGSVTGGSNWCEKSSGNHDFGENPGEILALQHKAILEETNSAMWAFVNAPVGSWTRTLTLFAEYPNGDYVMDENGQWGGHVSHNQIISYFPSANDPRGEYQVHFVDDKEGSKFNCYLKCWTYVPDSRNLPNDVLPPAESFTLQNAEVSYVPEISKLFIKPMNPHFSEQSYIQSSSAPLNAIQLSNQFYDETSGLFVNSLKDYSVGDDIEFCDNIIDIVYYEEDDMTELVFDCGTNDFYWQFLGDLRNDYSVGDMIHLSLTVEAEAISDGYVFENLDYILDNYVCRENGTYPLLSDYLIKK